MKKYQVLVKKDPLSENPRVCGDTQWTLYVKGNRYFAGDLPYTVPDVSVFSVPLWAYIAGGLKITTKSGSGSWQPVGVASCKLAPDATQKEKADALIVLQTELAEYNAWLNGELYCWVINEVCPCCGRTDDIVDSCGGYFSVETAKSEGEDALRALIDDEEFKDAADE